MVYVAWEHKPYREDGENLIRIRMPISICTRVFKDVCLYSDRQLRSSDTLSTADWLQLPMLIYKEKILLQ